MSGDVHVRFCESRGVRFPSATHLVVHCVSYQQAEYVKVRIGRRMQDCGLELNSEKTRLVYCKDGRRTGSYEHTRFTFLAYEFRARRARGREGKHFDGFNPAISPQAAKRLRREIRTWRLCRWTTKPLPELARWANPRILGWINYYGHFYVSALHPLLRNINEHLARWARRKYKRLRNNRYCAYQLLKRVARQEPGLFAHWRLGSGVQP